MTYETLRDRALSQTGNLGQSEAESVAQIALEEAMKFVAFHVRIPTLIASAIATAPASPALEANAIALEGGAGTFQISPGVYQCPDRLYVKKDSTTVGYGTPYNYIEYHHYLDLKQVPAGQRIGLLDAETFNEAPDFPWTITPSQKVWSESLAEANILTLFYRKSPAAYGDGTGTPEILPKYDYLLVNGAKIAVEYFLREPAEMKTMWRLFEEHLIPDVQRYDLEINGQRKRSSIKLHRSYRVF